MDGLSKQIASEIGPKWVQLLSKLQLGYRDRYRFCVQHKDEPKPLQEANCTRDTIRLLKRRALWAYRICCQPFICL